VPRRAPLRPIAVLNDFGDAARWSAGWSGLTAVEVFRDHVEDEAALAARFASFDAVVLIRGRTPFPRSLPERLPLLRLLVTTGMRNRILALDVCTARGWRCAERTPAPRPRPR